MRKFIWIAILFFVSCKSTSEEYEKVFINIDDRQIEIVSDEYGNQYLKQITHGPRYIYIPFPFDVEEEGDTLHSFQAKKYAKRRF